MELLDNCITDDVMNQEGIGCDNMTCSIICLSQSGEQSGEANNNKNIVQKTAQYMVDNTNPNYKNRHGSSSSNINSDITTKKKSSSAPKKNAPAGDFQFPQ